MSYYLFFGGKLLMGIGTLLPMGTGCSNLGCVQVPYWEHTDTG